MNVYDHAHALARAIRQSSELRQYREALEKLNSDETARKMLQDFRDMQMQIQNKKMQNQEVPPEEEEKFNRLSEIVNMNQTVKDYLEKEYRLSIMMRDVQRIIGEVVEKEIGGEEDKEPSEED